ncbi:hypothetical protein N7478_003055 [Penicillium angulare]|uniref:uncharacterized protein n=1 Tax=Penicillium angulare TaxID=116970 RepID=UPI002540FD34|nr:uncharacterized protein N7478_003055 [Penicillium angulare]KAJ5287369.1 hypothetical protein N7478_003055 [Penicillium angulare]
MSASYQQRTNISTHIVEIRDKTVEVLEKYNIHHDTFAVTGRISMVRSENEPIPTVLVVIPHQSPRHSSKWCEAAQILHSMLDPQFPEISIELIDEKMMYRPECSPVPHSHSIIPKWKQICTGILNSRCDITEWTGIALWPYGIEDDPNKNRLTVLVSVLESAIGPFWTSARRIQDILVATNEHDIDVLFLKNEHWHRFDKPDYLGIEKGPRPPTEICTNRVVYPEVSIGIQNSDTDTASTLGGIAELKNLKDFQ